MKISKISKTLLMTMCIVIMMSSAVLAMTYSKITPSDSGLASSDIGTKTNTVLGMMQWAGYIIAIGMIIWVGVKYLMAGAGEKAKAKETMIPIVIGAVLVAGAATLAKVLFTTV